MLGINKEIQKYNAVAEKLKQHAAGFMAIRLKPNYAEQLKESEAAQKAYGRHRILRKRLEDEKAHYCRLEFHYSVICGIVKRYLA